MSVGRVPWGLGVVQRAGGGGGGAVAAFVSRGLDRFWPLAPPCAGAGGNSLLPLIEAWSRDGPPAAYAEGPRGPGEALGEGARLLAPLVPPRNIMCVGKNYLEHVGEVDSTMPGISKAKVPEFPIIFTKAPSAVAGPGEPVVFPEGLSERVDYEGEVAVVIGRGGRDIPRERALEHVWGFTVMNDLTARDVQKRHQQWFLGKSIDGFAPLGPVLVPKERVPEKLHLTTRVNGELRQECRDCLNTLIFDIPHLLSTISRSMTLQPGDIIATGTPKGVGAGFDPARFLRVGDTVSVAVDGIGTLENTFVSRSRL